MSASIEPGSDSLLPTRESLLFRLQDWRDEAGWREFFESYWRLIYNVARQAGLADSDAQEVVQNTFIYLVRRMPNFHYDRRQGSFKGWLREVTRSRIQVYWRRQKADRLHGASSLFDADLESNEAGGGPDRPPDALDAIWQREWEEHLIELAFQRLRSKASGQQLLIFRLATFNHLALKQVAEKLEVSLGQVYLARHRVAKLFKAEIQRLRRETE
jgi:RNA polymerase sigma factor (sigma-70 family)